MIAKREKERMMMSIINREKKSSSSSSPPREYFLIISSLDSSLVSCVFYIAFFFLSLSLFYIRSLPWCPLLSQSYFLHTTINTILLTHKTQQGINVLTDRRESSWDSSLVMPFCLEAIIWNLPNLKVKTHHCIIQPESAQNRSHEGERERWKIGL